MLAGNFNSSFSLQPKYYLIWSVQTVIDFIRKESGRNQKLFDKFLSYKLTILVVLTSASRTLGLEHLNIRFMVKTSSSFTFTFHKLYKAWRKEKSPTYIADSSLCYVAVFKQISEEIRNTKNFWWIVTLFGFVQLYKAVVSSTISAWIKKCL